MCIRDVVVRDSGPTVSFASGDESPNPLQIGYLPQAQASTTGISPQIAAVTAVGRAIPIRQTVSAGSSVLVPITLRPYPGGRHDLIKRTGSSRRFNPRAVASHTLLMISPAASACPTRTKQRRRKSAEVVQFLQCGLATALGGDDVPLGEDLLRIAVHRYTQRSRLDGRRFRVSAPRGRSFSTRYAEIGISSPAFEAGTVKKKVVPSSGADSAQIRPP